VTHGPLVGQGGPESPLSGSMNHRGGSRIIRLLPLFFLGWAVLLRSLYLHVYAHQMPFYSFPQADARIYLDWAREIAAGDWLSRTQGVFYRAPLYPYVVALLVRVLGQAAPAIQILQATLGLGSVILVGLLARRMAGMAAALAAMALLSFYGPLLAAESKVMPTVLGIFLHLASLWSILAFVDRPRWRRGIPAGACLGLSTLIRPHWVLLGLAFPLVMKLSARHDPLPLRRWTPFWLGLLLVLAPVSLRNRVVGGEWVPVSSNGGMTFYQGNNEDNSTGLLTLLPRFELFGSASLQESWELKLASEEVGHPVGPAGASAHWTRRGIDFILGHPGAWVALEARKLLRFMSSYEWSDDVSFYLERSRTWPLWIPLLPFGVLLALAAIGLGTGEAQADSGAAAARRLILVSAAMGLLSCLTFYVSSRYRMESVPALAVLGGAAVARWAKARPAPRRWLPVAPAAVLLVLSVLPPGRVARSQESAGMFQLGQALEAEGRSPEALSAYARARTLVPGNVYAWNAGARLLARTGRPHSADSLLAGAPIRPVLEHPLTRFTRGLLLEQRGDTEGSIADFEAALRGNPLLVEAHAHLARLYGDRRDYEHAIQETNAALAQNPQDPDLLALLAYDHIQLRQFAPARDACLALLRLRPADQSGRFNLAVASFFLGDLDQAEKAMDAIGPGGDSSPDPLIDYYRGLLQWRRGNAARATVDLGRVCSVDPRNRRALYYRSLALSRTGELNASRPELRGAWETAYGADLKPAWPILSEWLSRRASLDWGSPIDLQSRELLDRLGRVPGGAAPAADLMRISEEEAVPDTSLR
jgi:Flp pilus assembly protein TadD/4-amino-4-deoxy-L-arabinose transferase-like glycosyltransferase